MSFLRKLLAQAAPPEIEAEVFARTLARFPFLARLAPQERDRLRATAAEFIRRKAFTGAAGLVLDDDIVVGIAMQACLPVMHLGLDMFDDFSEVIVYPGQFHVAREIVDDAGVVHDASGPLSGEAMPGGPVVLSWEDVGFAADDDGYNVVVHEFAHKLDMTSGTEADGVPPFHPRLHAGLDEAGWIETIDTAYDEFCDALDALEADFPEHLDPESDAGAAWYARLPLDAYAAEHPAEFFAVASETYFVAPDRLRAAFPALFDLLDRYYRPRNRTQAQTT